MAQRMIRKGATKGSSRPKLAPQEESLMDLEGAVNYQRNLSRGKSRTQQGSTSTARASSVIQSQQAARFPGVVAARPELSGSVGQSQSVRGRGRSRGRGAGGRGGLKTNKAGSSQSALSTTTESAANGARQTSSRPGRGGPTNVSSGRTAAAAAQGGRGARGGRGAATGHTLSHHHHPHHAASDQASSAGRSLKRKRDQQSHHEHGSAHSHSHGSHSQSKTDLSSNSKRMCLSGNGVEADKRLFGKKSFLRRAQEDMLASGSAGTGGETASGSKATLTRRHLNNASSSTGLSGHHGTAKGVGRPASTENPHSSSSSSRGGLMQTRGKKRGGRGRGRGEERTFRLDSGSGLGNGLLSQALKRSEAMEDRQAAQKSSLTLRGTRKRRGGRAGSSVIHSLSAETIDSLKEKAAADTHRDRPRRHASLKKRCKCCEFGEEHVSDGSFIDDDSGAEFDTSARKDRDWRSSTVRPKASRRGRLSRKLSGEHHQSTTTTKSRKPGQSDVNSEPVILIHAYPVWLHKVPSKEEILEPLRSDEASSSRDMKGAESGPRSEKVTFNQDAKLPGEIAYMEDDFYVELADDTETDSDVSSLIDRSITEEDFSKDDSVLLNKAKLDSESVKQDSVNVKQYSESTKQDRESAKQDSESADIDSESAKQDRESAKLDSESARLDSESAKLDSESVKLDSESAKQDSESAKLNSDSVKLDSEKAKPNLESELKVKPDSESAKQGSESVNSDLESAVPNGSESEHKTDSDSGKLLESESFVTEDEKRSSENPVGKEEECAVNDAQNTESETVIPPARTNTVGHAASPLQPSLLDVLCVETESESNIPPNKSSTVTGDDALSENPCGQIPRESVEHNINNVRVCAGDEDESATSSRTAGGVVPGGGVPAQQSQDGPGTDDASACHDSAGQVPGSVITTLHQDNTEVSHCTDDSARVETARTESSDEKNIGESTPQVMTSVEGSEAATAAGEKGANVTFGQDSEMPHCNDDSGPHIPSSLAGEMGSSDMKNTSGESTQITDSETVVTTGEKVNVVENSEVRGKDSLPREPQGEEDDNVQDDEVMLIPEDIPDTAQDDNDTTQKRLQSAGDTGADSSLQLQGRLDVDGTAAKQDLNTQGGNTDTWVNTVRPVLL